ncbi:hypothetical protein RhiirA5_503234 [Rhizophagus irregularis]|uniref:Uncharacterized protein n=1 Tax=Rhizophagus irregularis TaxID=588596 RepID=A0A2N0PA94_9GLOM|nr:hypothetical protein RhiirA5_503234 [Rhizophagus irregularis]
MPGIYGISQNPDTNDFILVFQHYKTTTIRYTMKILANWISGNEKIDELIQKMQLKIHERSDTVFEWISYTIFLNKNKMKIRLSIKKKNYLGFNGFKELQIDDWSPSYENPPQGYVFNFKSEALVKVPEYKSSGMSNCFRKAKESGLCLPLSGEGEQVDAMIKEVMATL